MGLLDGRYSDDPDKNSAINQGLLALGLGLLNSKGSFGNALGQAGLMGMDSYQGALQNLQRNKSAKLQQEAAQLQIEAARQAEAQRQRQQAFLQNLPSPGGVAMANGQGPTMENAARMPPVDPMQQQLLEATRAGVIPYEQYLAAQNKTASPIKLGAGDQLLDPKTFKPLASNPKEDSTPTAVREYQFAVSQGYKGTFNDFVLNQKRAGASNVTVGYGSPVAGVDANGNPVYIQPSKDGSAPYVVPGVRPPKSAAEERTEAERRDRERSGRQMVSVMDDADKLLKAGRATGSGVGTIADAAGRAVGYTSEGAQDSARLQALSGWLVANVPRMEGPQSNFDVQNYMTMAGKIGDSTAPLAERRAALDTVRKLQRKYAEINGTPLPESQESVDDLVNKYRSKK